MMPIVNVTKDTVIAHEYGEARSSWEQFRGLMFRRVSPLVFFFDAPQKLELHSFFCRGDMDLVLLNDEWEVVELHREWNPWRIFRSRMKVSFLLELPSGSIFSSRTELGDIVHIR